MHIYGQHKTFVLCGNENPTIKKGFLWSDQEKGLMWYTNRIDYPTKVITLADGNWFVYIKLQGAMKLCSDCYSMHLLSAV